MLHSEPWQGKSCRWTKRGAESQGGSKNKVEFVKTWDENWFWKIEAVWIFRGREWQWAHKSTAPQKEKDTHAGPHLCFKRHSTTPRSTYLTCHRNLPTVVSFIIRQRHRGGKDSEKKTEKQFWPTVLFTGLPFLLPFLFFSHFFFFSNQSFSVQQ